VAVAAVLCCAVLCVGCLLRPPPPPPCLPAPAPAQARKVVRWAQSARCRATARDCVSLLRPFVEFAQFRRSFPFHTPKPFAQVSVSRSACQPASS
jgi:hypothetical protein